MLATELECKEHELQKHLGTLTDNIFSDSSKILFLEAPVGAGKTTFIRNLLSYLGFNQVFQSPTFVFKKEYIFFSPILKKEIKTVHADFYRVQEDDMVNAFLQEEANLKIAEWGSLVFNKDFLQKNLILQIVSFIDYEYIYKTQPLKNFNKRKYQLLKTD
jgi:tRNA threonylcarbamoyl adenosine modification protein YjeE